MTPFLADYNKAKGLKNGHHLNTRESLWPRHASRAAIQNVRELAQLEKNQVQ